MTRTHEQIRQHYQVERELADRLRVASAEDRRTLYAQVYDELFRRVPDHPQLTRKIDPDAQKRQVDLQLQLLSRFITPEVVFLEIGAGDCSLSLRLAGRVRQVYAIDVSDEIARTRQPPENFQLVLSDGTNIPVPAGGATLAYSNQLMEHLHPDDALAQLRHVFDALAPGGRYVCVTPNRLSGPHDVSRYFDPVATGFHLKEYTAGELARIFRQVGFVNIAVYPALKGVSFRCPLALMRMLEGVLAALPASARKSLMKLPLVGSALAGVLGLALVGEKPA